MTWMVSAQYAGAILTAVCFPEVVAPPMRSESPSGVRPAFPCHVPDRLVDDFPRGVQIGLPGAETDHVAHAGSTLHEVVAGLGGAFAGRRCRAFHGASLRKAASA